MNKLKKYYSKLSAPVKASIFFTICNILQRGVSLITAPIFTRLLTTEQYGLYSVYNSWYSIISIFATFNLSYGVFIRGITKYDDDRDKFTSAMQGLSTTITVIFFIIYIIAHDYWNQLFELPTMFIVMMFVELLFVPAFAFWSNLQRNEYKYKALVIVTLAMSVANPILGIVAVLLTEHKAEARVITSVLVQVCVPLIFYIIQFYRGKKFYVKKYWKYALTFNIPLIPHYLSMTVLQQADRLMISKLVGNSEAAIYSVAYTVSTIMTLVTQAINNSFTPYTYQMIKTKNYKKIGNAANLLLILVGCGCIFAIAFGPEIIKIMAPIEYYDAIWIIPPVAISVYFMFLYPLFGNIEFYFEETKFTMFASCIGAVLNVVLNAIFIPIFGYYAAGYTTLVCYILFAVAHYFVYKNICNKKISKNKIYDGKFIVILSVILVLAMIVMTFVYEFVLIRYAIILIILVVLFIKRTKIIEELKMIKKR